MPTRCVLGSVWPCCTREDAVLNWVACGRHLWSAPVLDGVLGVGIISEEVERHEPVYFRQWRPLLYGRPD